MASTSTNMGTRSRTEVTLPGQDPGPRTQVQVQVQVERCHQPQIVQLCLLGAPSPSRCRGSHPLMSATMTIMSRTGDAAPVAGFTALLRIREFRLLWLADAQSLLGDQLARVALSVLVYDRTGSGLVTAAVYALTFLPALAGSVLLGPLADRLPRRALLIGGDLVRATLLAALALPALSVPVLSILLVVAVLVGTP